MPLRGSEAATFEFKNWSGARDLNPRPHGPELCAVSSTETDFEDFELNSKALRAISGRLQPPTSPGLLHELLHDLAVVAALRLEKWNRKSAPWP